MRPVLLTILFLVPVTHSFAEEAMKPTESIILRLYRTNPWGVRGEDTKGVRILDSGEVQCTLATQAGPVVYSKLREFPADLIGTLKRQIETLEEKTSTGETECFDDTRQIYDTGKGGDKNIIFLDQAMTPGCGNVRIESSESYYLEGILDALYYACPAPPSPEKSQKQPAALD